MKKITIYNNLYWINKGYSEKYAIEKVIQCKKENSCWNKEFWMVKKGYNEEDAIKKVKDNQQKNSKKQDKSKIENQYLIETWIKKGYSEEISAKKVQNLKNKSNIYKNKSIIEMDEIILKRRNTFYSKSVKERTEINISKGRTKNQLIDKFGEEYVEKLSEKRGSGRRNSIFRRYSKISKSFFDELSSYLDIELFYAEKEEWIRYDKNKGYYIDLLVKNTNKIIEFNGDFYHANPEIYTKDSIIKMSKTKILSASQIWEQDEKKISTLNNLGYEVLIIWEYDVLHNKQSIIDKCINYIKK